MICAPATRAIWTQTHASWPVLSAQDKRSFVYDVLRFGIGEQLAGQLLGVTQNGAGATGGGSSTVMPDIDSGYAGQGCWASAGCTGYDGATAY